MRKQHDERLVDVHIDYWNDVARNDYWSKKVISKVQIRQDNQRIIKIGSETEISDFVVSPPRKDD